MEHLLNTSLKQQCYAIMLGERRKLCRKHMSYDSEEGSCLAFMVLDTHHL
jgi:hypothetical protein